MPAVEADDSSGEPKREPYYACISNHSMLLTSLYPSAVLAAYQELINQ